MSRAERFSVDLSHLSFLERYLTRRGFYEAAQAMQDKRKAVQELWARAVFVK